MRFQDKKLDHNFVLNLYNFVHKVPLAPQIWIAESARRKDVENLGLDVQNCAKWVQNYDPVFYVETAFGGGMHVSAPTPKFKLWLAEEERMYKIVQNEYKIMIQLFMLKLHLEGGCTFPTPTPKFELRLAVGGRMYKIWDLVYKIVQNEYKIIIQFFMLKPHLGWLYVTSPPNLSCR